MPAELRNPAPASLSTSIVKAGQSMTDGQSREFFWGCTLTKASNEVVWSTEDEDDDEDFLKHTLFLRHAVLGHNAPADQRHIVELETKDNHGDTVKQPILTMRLGMLEMVALDLNFPNEIPVTFRLIHGDGPVYINGQQLIEFPEETLDDTAPTEDEDELEEDEEEEDEEAGDGEEEEEAEGSESEEDGEEEEEAEETDSSKKSASKATKRKASLTASKKQKTKKGRRDTSASEQGTEDDEDDEESMEADEEPDDDEEEEEEKEKSYSKKKRASKGKDGSKVVKKAKAKSVVTKKGKKAKA